MGIFRRKEAAEDVAEAEALKEAVHGAHMPAIVEKVALKEIARLLKMGSSSAEYTIGINYIDYLVSLPWNRMTEDHLDIPNAESILDGEHYGLADIKDRIIEYLAVRILKMSHKHKILIVDDEEMTRKNLEHVLTKEGYVVVTAANGMKAFLVMDQETFDLVITDLKMDQVDGMGVLKRAKEQNPATEVIIISGYATVSNAVEAMNLGSYHFLAKPLGLDEIRATVKKALSNKRAQLESRGPVLCFVGPPGTGKTSLGRAIAKSLDRKFVRISLAGMKDEAQIRGHRRSYVGALPGRIIQEIKRCETKNPLFMLDELDKIGQEFKGDPAAALLEVLDPEQNTQFIDHYLDVPFDLSSVMFIATANTTDAIPAPLLDRLEVLPLSGYTEQEKKQIATRHLIPQQIEEAGLAGYPVRFTPEAIQTIIRDYTREAGLRGLQRQIAAICRKTAREIHAGQRHPEAIIDPDGVARFLGPQKYHFEVTQAKDRVGVATGLAWTETGGEIIFIEATKMKGKNRLILTGSLGDVMKESAQAALSYIRSNTDLFDISSDFFDYQDIHVHVPAGAVPKDGPSAGLSIAIALLSLLTARPCRRSTAVSGELTLTGRILPVGGIREKALAAHRAGVKSVVFPARNEPDIREIPDEVQKDLNLVTVSELKDVVDLVLL